MLDLYLSPGRYTVWYRGPVGADPEFAVFGAKDVAAREAEVLVYRCMKLYGNAYLQATAVTSSTARVMTAWGNLQPRLEGE